MKIPKIAAFIPARSGSKGIPDKNIQRLCGKSLLEWSVSYGTTHPLVSSTYISTDSDYYEKIAVGLGARSFGLRSANLASDTAQTVDVVLDFISKTSDKYEYLLLLQPTSPVRKYADLENMVHMLGSAENDPSAVVSISPIDEPHPFKLKSLANDGTVTPFLPHTNSEIPRQLLPPVYRLNGAYYLVKTESILEHHSLLPPKSLGYTMKYCHNIDSFEDLQLLQAITLQKPEMLSF